jgi:hypothetical protein
MNHTLASIRTTFLLIFFASSLILFPSCGTTTENDPQTESTCDVRKYVPLAEGNRWIYTTTTTDKQGLQTTTKDTLSVQQFGMYRGTPTYFLSQGYMRIPDSTKVNFESGQFITPLNIFPRCCVQWWMPLLQCTLSDQWQQRDTMRQDIRTSIGGNPNFVTQLSIYRCSVALSTQGVTTIKGVSRAFKTYTYTVQYHQEFIPDGLSSEWDNITEVKFSIQFAKGVGIISMEGIGFKRSLLDYTVKP